MDLDDFRWRIRESISYVTASNNISQWLVDDYTDCFELDVTQILDICVPLHSTTKHVSNHTSRFLSEEARSAKQACRRAERRFRRTGSTSDKANYNKARKTAPRLIDESRVSQICRDIAEAGGDPKRLWRTTKQLLHPQMPTSMNDNECATMASNFCSFFSDKVERIRTLIKSASLGQLFLMSRFSGQSLSSFGTVTSGEVLKMTNYSERRTIWQGLCVSEA